MNYQLIVLKGPNASKVLPIRTEVTNVGRQEDCQVRIVSSEVSRKHCQLLEKDGKLFVKDLNSSNGTFINGRRIKDQESLEHGAELSVGPLTFRIDKIGSPPKASDTAPGAPSPAPAAKPAAAPPPAAKPAEDDFDLIFDDPSPAPPPPPKPKPAPAAAPAPAKGGGDEFEIDFGDDPGQVTISQPLPAKPQAAPATKAGAQPASPPPPPVDLPASPGVDEAVADFLLDLKLGD